MKMYKNNNNESFEFEAQGPLLHISRYQINNIKKMLESLGKKVSSLFKRPLFGQNIKNNRNGGMVAIVMFIKQNRHTIVEYELWRLFMFSKIYSFMA